MSIDQDNSADIHAPQHFLNFFPLPQGLSVAQTRSAASLLT